MPRIKLTLIAAAAITLLVLLSGCSTFDVLCNALTDIYSGSKSVTYEEPVVHEPEINPGVLLTGLVDGCDEAEVVALFDSIPEIKGYELPNGAFKEYGNYYMPVYLVDGADADSVIAALQASGLFTYVEKDQLVKLRIDYDENGAPIV